MVPCNRRGRRALLRALLRTLVVVAALALPAAGVRAQSDPFQSHVLSAPAPAAKPRPQPRRPAETEPAAVVAPAPAAPVPPPAQPLPSAGEVWARVRQTALTQGIDVPLASSPAFDAATLPQFRSLLGAWGPGVWQGSSADDRVILIVLGVGGDGVVRGVVGHHAGRGWSNFAASPAGNGFTMHVQLSYEASGRETSIRTIEDDDWRFELRSDGRLYGFRRGNASTIVLPRLQ